MHNKTERLLELQGLRNAIFQLLK